MTEEGVEKAAEARAVLEAWDTRGLEWLDEVRELQEKLRRCAQALGHNLDQQLKVPDNSLVRQIEAHLAGLPRASQEFGTN